MRIGYRFNNLIGAEVMPLVSVIVPVYNVEKYLRQCIDSILMQTLYDIEIICVDDGSTDQSGKILDEYALADQRIKVIHKANAGYGAAMNTGIDIAEGKYIGIVESDDKIDSHMFENLYIKAEKYDLDFIKSEAFYWYEEIGYLSRIHSKKSDGYFNKVLKEDYRNVFFDFFMNIWTGIYNRDFIKKNEIRFNESAGASYQDNSFWMQTCLYARKAMWLDEAYYYYRQDNPEASVKSTSKMMAMPLEYDYLENLLKKREQYNLLPYCYSMKLFRMRGVYYRIADEKKIEFSNYIREMYDEYKGYIRMNKYIDDFFRYCIEDPIAYANGIILGKQKVREKIGECGGVIIYGAGQFGDIAFRTLYNEGAYNAIKCFAVSDCSKQEGLAGKKVLNILEALKEYPNAMVLVAVAPNGKAYKEMTVNLNRYHVDKYMSMSDILNNFYIL